MRVLLTGAGGFLGRRLLPLLRASGHVVVAIGRDEVEGADEMRICDLHDHPRMRSAVEGSECEWLIHLAWLADPPRFWGDIENFSWLATSLELCKAFSAAGGRRLVISGSCAEYGVGNASPISERVAAAPNTLYGRSKDALLQMLLSAGDALQDLDVAWARIFFPYGPREPKSKLMSWLVSEFDAARLPALREPGRVLDFIYVDDVAGALCAIANSTVSGCVNVGSGIGFSIKDVASKVAAIVRPEAIPLVEAIPVGTEVPPFVADISRLRAECGYGPGVTLDAGIASLVRSMQSQDGPHG